MTDETNTPLSPLKRAFLAVQSLQGRVDELESARNEPIAIVGMSCRFPGAESLERYWELLAAGRDAVTERPSDRWSSDLLDPDDDVAERGSRWGGFLSTVDTFDPQFFSIAPREAVGMDPQQRLFLEVCWEALEHAGIAPDSLNGHPTGVFAGACTNDYSNLQLRGGDLTTLGTHYASGIAHSIVTGRISYLLGLTGPSVTVDTACSSSLTAVHLACQALRNGDCDMALAGGVNTILLPDVAVAYARAGMAAADGRCKVFDASADGFVRGEGSGVIVLKRLSKAQADGDTIHALIRGSALNQDGASSSMTAPSGPAQESVIRSALRAAKMNPREISYVEAHGTGTVLGDPIEVQAIGAALGVDRASGDHVYVGSVKSNFGHLEASAGIAGLIKIVLSMQHGQIPASLHFTTPNPMIPWDRLPVRVPTSLTEWAGQAGSRAAGISGFGFSGTNAHLIISEAPAMARTARSGAERPSHVVALSAPTETGLRAVAGRVAEHLSAHSELDTADVAHTMNVGRAQFRHRAALVVDSNETTVSQLRAIAASHERDDVAQARISGVDAPRIMFLFSGQGSQYAGMGRRLYESQPTFRRVIDECDELLRSELQPSVREVLYPTDGGATPLDETRYTQPVLFAFEYALASMWQSWGVQPNALMGHSLGEFVAATIAGVFRLEDALRLVALRGRLGERLPGSGSMAAVLTDATTVQTVLSSLGDAVTIAAVNAPESNVISGPNAAMSAAIAVFASRGVEVRPLPISNAFHSPAIEPMLAEFEVAASAISYGVQRIPVFSNLFGRRATAGEMSNGQYWTRHLREPVQFAAGFAAAVGEGYSNFLEVGPHTTLVGLGRQSFPDNPGLWLPTLRRGHDEWGILLSSLAQLYVSGVRVNWAEFDRDYSRRRVVLPTYPFERQRYWVTPSVTRIARARPEAVEHPLLARRIDSPFVHDEIFETALSVDTLPWLADHRVLGAIVLPATAYLEAVWAAATKTHGDRVSALDDIDVREALVVPEQSSRTMQLALSPVDGNAAHFEIMSADGSAAVAEKSWRAHASGTVTLDAHINDESPADLAAIRERCGTTIAATRLYDAVGARGIELGARFRGVAELYQGKDEALGRLYADDALATELSRYHMHPGQLDAALHVVTAALFDEANLSKPGETYMPIAIERFRVLETPARDLWTHAVARPRAENASPVADVRVYDDLGALVAEVIGLQFRRVETASWADGHEHEATSDARDHFYRIEWQPAEAVASLAPAIGWYAPEPGVVAESLNESVDALAQQHRLDEYQRRMPEIDARCRDFIIGALRSLGWAPAIGDREDERALADRLLVVDRHRRLFHRLLSILEEDQFLAREGSSWLVRRRLDAAPMGGRLTALRESFPEAAGELGLLGIAGPELAACLTGRVDPLSLLFPGGSFDAADELYRRSPSALVANALARSAVEQLIAAVPSDRDIRVLEIGAGTGGTTSFVLPLLPAARTKYLFTDLSPLFLARAEERFTAFPFVEYRELDVERDPMTQGFERQSFDLVIAANVLHATRDLSETVAHVRDLVRPGGMLTILESTRSQRWIDLTFGLTDGWWRYTDTALRAEYPLIDARQWKTVLAGAGFEQSASVPDDSHGAADVFAPNLLLVARTPSVATDRWIVFADDGGVGDDLAAELRGRGHAVFTVRRGEQIVRDRDDAWRIPATDADAYRQLIEAATADGASRIAGMVHLWSLDSEPGERSTLDDWHNAQDLSCHSALLLVQAAAAASATSASRLVLVTRGAQSITRDDARVPAHATIWGLAGTIRLEHPDLDCRTVDLDPHARHDDVLAGLVDRIVVTGESQLGVRDGVWHVPRLVRFQNANLHTLTNAAHDVNVVSAAGMQAVASGTSDLNGSAEPALRLANATPGVLDGLAFVADERRQPGPGEIEIRVDVSALNFRDVLVAMGFFPDSPEIQALGGECAGEVVAVGEGVSGFVHGDVVVAMARSALGSHVIAPAELVLCRPTTFTLDDAVTLPNAFVTAWHSLYDVAKLRRGETVLIHAGAGGVGMAAIQLAARVGATVFATAGSPEKRAYLASIGVQHVMDSRSTAYASAIAEITDGRGVDVVLNSLADDHIERSLASLASNGRFVELGKRGVWSRERVREQFPTIDYTVVDLLAAGIADPSLLGTLLRKVGDVADAGEITPLPTTVFESDRVVDAFRYMAQAKHIGKVLVRKSGTRRTDVVRGDATYLITGGLGGLGMVVADWLLQKGAGHVVLVSRRPANEETRNRIDAWNHAGQRVSVILGDVAHDQDVGAIMNHVALSLPPLRGVIHSAGLLDDAVLANQSWERFESVFAPKVYGAWNLHRHTARVPLDFFILFSSISALLGSAGQGNHAAANAFMDALAHYRRERGWPAQSINWGAWSDTGAAMERNVAARIGAQGMGSIASVEGVAQLEQLLRANPIQAAVMPVEWNTFSRQFAGGRLRGGLLSGLTTEPARASRARKVVPAARPERATEAPIRDAAPSVRWDMLLQRMRALAARVLGLEAPMLPDSNRPLQELGLDSLMAVELRNLMKTELGLERAPAATVVFDHPTVQALTDFIGSTSFGWGPRVEAGRSAASPSAKPLGISNNVSQEMDLLDDLERLSPEEAARLLRDRLSDGAPNT